MNTISTFSKNTSAFSTHSVFKLFFFSIQTSNSTKSSEEQAGGILDSNSPQFRKGLYYAIVCFGIAILLSLTYEVIRRVRKRHKVHQQGECHAFFRRL